VPASTGKNKENFPNPQEWNINAILYKNVFYHKLDGCVFTGTNTVCSIELTQEFLER